MLHTLYNMGSLGHTNSVTALWPRGDSLEANPSTPVALQPPALWAPGVALGGGCGRELELICQGHTRGSRIPSLLVVQIRGWGFLCPSPHNLREVQAPSEFWKQVPKKGPVCAEAWADS